MHLKLVWICCLIVVGAVLALLISNKDTKEKESVTVQNSNAPTVSFNDVNMIINSPQGVPQYKLSAPKYWLYHDEQRSEFQHPEITIYNDDGTEINASSLKGETSEDNDVITLLGNVVINQPQSNKNSNPLKLTTDKITLYPEKHQAYTKSLVTAVRGKQKVTATGMTINLNTQILFLHSNVIGRYEP